MNHWLGVVCRDHVRRGTGLGIAQLGHGRRDFHPWRRRVRYETGAAETPIRSLTLDLTSAPHWGHQLRRGLIPLSGHDFAAIRSAMLASSSVTPS